MFFCSTLQECIVCDFRRLFKEPNVIILVGLTSATGQLTSADRFSFSPVNGFIYVFWYIFYVLMDAVMLKSRYLMIGVGLAFVVLNLYNFYGSTLGDEGIGVVLLKYHIQGEEYTIMKRSTKRSIYLQVLLFSANGIYTTLWTITIFLLQQLFHQAFYFSILSPKAFPT